ncbi:MAG: hypothetical protein ACYCYP_14110 [Leptospirales bacterium]
MSIWKIAEYAVGILVPLRMFWAGERGWFRWVVVGKIAPDSARGGSPESGAKMGALPRFAPPLQDLGQHASCRNERKSSVRAVRDAVRTAFEPLLKRFLWRFGQRFARWTKERCF